MILFVCAVARELDFLPPSPRYDVLATGIGPVDAAAAAAAAIAGGRYDLVVNAGIAGAFTGRAAIGEEVIVAADAFAGLGTQDGALALRDGSTFATTAASDPALVERLAGGSRRVGRGVTVACVTAEQETARRLAREFDATVESMEGFAVLRAAHMAGVRAIELRGISNIVGPRDAGGFDFAAGRAAVARLVTAFLEIDEAS